ncbi:hypothetical protein HX071_15355 [Myroides marinus]|uniref:hypothetical protein n=1 Tax=Myroides marinus TaxID=703342 RepID=UPI0025776CCD|nr:hypothetical protein [Myroides marinus]MDM1503565.1 hypothetical protein [Myroides marinus]
MKKLIYFALTIISLGLTTSCSSDDNNSGSTENKETITNEVISQKEGDYTFKVYSNVKEFYAPSANPIRVEIIDNNDPTNKTFTNTKMTLMMHMPSKSHSAPMTQLQPLAGSSNKFLGEVMFTMAGMDLSNNYWAITIETENKGQKIKTEIKTTVRQGNFVKGANYANTDRKTLQGFNYNGARYQAAMHEVKNPIVGNNPYYVTIYKSTDGGMKFPVSDEFVIDIDPRMPDMGNHGVGQVIPSLVFNTNTGKYEGKIIFNMGGYWYINLLIKDKAGNIVAGQFVPSDSQVNSEAFFDIMLKND